MTGKQLRNSILQWAIQGKLVPQDPNDEPAFVLLERIRAEKARLVKEKKIKKDKNETIIYRGDDNSYYEKTLATGAIRCIDSEIPFDIPKGWEWVRLSHVSDVARGGSPRPIKNYITSDANGVNWIKIGDTEIGGKYISSTKEKIKVSGVSKSRYVHIGDFLLTNSMSFGRPYILKTDGCIHDGWLVISPFENSYTQDFLYYLLSSNFAFSQFSDKVSGAVVKNLNSEKVAATLFPIPPIREQERIVKLMDSLSHLIEGYTDIAIDLQKLNTSIHSKLKKSILQEAIQGRLVPQIESEGTAEDLLAEIRAEKQRLVKEGKLKKSALSNESRIFRGGDNKYRGKLGVTVVELNDDLPFEIPKSWCWCRLGDIFAHNTGKALNGGGKGEYLLPYITTSNLYWDRFDLTSVKKMYFSKQELDKCTAKKGDLLVCEGGDVGRAAIWEREDICLQNHVHKLRAYLPVCQRYFLFVLWHYKNIGLIGGKGIGIQGLSANAIHNLILPLPPIKEQNRIADAIDSYLQILSK